MAYDHAAITHHDAPRSSPRRRFGLDWWYACCRSSRRNLCTRGPTLRGNEPSRSECRRRSRAKSCTPLAASQGGHAPAFGRDTRALGVTGLLQLCYCVLAIFVLVLVTAIARADATVPIVRTS